MVIKPYFLRRLFLPLLVVTVLCLIGVCALAISGQQDDIAKADAALVLGSKVESDGTPSARLRARLDRTAELYRLGWFPLVIVSGGLGKEGYDEAAVMMNYLQAQGIPRECIVMDSDGITTYESARNTALILEQRKLKSIFVISQYFHIPRARLALRHFGITEVHSASAHFYEWRDVYSLARELPGYVYYAFRGITL